MFGVLADILKEKWLKTIWEHNLGFLLKTIPEPGPKGLARSVAVSFPKETISFSSSWLSFAIRLGLFLLTCSSLELPMNFSAPSAPTMLSRILATFVRTTTDLWLAPPPSTV